jgi:hypothetical protein
MAEEIVNRVAKSPLITFNLEENYPEGNRISLDLSQWLDKGFILREKEFRAALKEVDFSVYQDSYVALHCSTEALIPAWANLLVTTYLQPIAKKVIWGSLGELENAIFQDLIHSLPIEPYKNQPVIIKGCVDKAIPPSAFIALVEKLQPHVKSLMYGEACSSVPLYKK